MEYAQTIGGFAQQPFLPPSEFRWLEPELALQIGSMLGNAASQRVAMLGTPASDTFARYYPLRVPAVSPALQALIRRRLDPEGKQERVERSLAALRQAEGIRLTREDWRWAAENPDIEEQF